MENSVLFGCFCVSSGESNKKKEEKDHLNEERCDCDLGNISSKTLNLKLSELNGIRCSAFNLYQEKKKLFTK